jgi:DNA-binding LytR/AlgR family response regulator
MINCVIVDDEPLARQLILSYVDQLPYINCVAVCQSAIEAFGVLHEQKIDVLFLDIQMPGISGINFLKSLKTAPKVIFTTAYSDYAVEAFEIDAIDYLLKPVTFERFIKAVQKLGSDNEILISNKPDSKADSYIFLKVDRRLVKVDFMDIVYVEAYGDYLKVHSIKETYITYMTLNKLELLLSNLRFIRIHRSTIINKAFIQFIEGNCIHVNDVNLAIGLTYRECLLANLGNT